MKKTTLFITAIVILIALALGGYMCWYNHQEIKALGEVITEFSEDFSAEHPEWENLPDTVYCREMKIQTGRNNKEEISFFLTWRAVIEPDSANDVVSYYVSQFHAKRNDSNSNVKIYQVNYYKGKAGIRASDLTCRYDDVLIGFRAMSHGNIIPHTFSIGGTGIIDMQNNISSFQ